MIKTSYHYSFELKVTISGNWDVNILHALKKTLTVLHLEI